jgi:laminin, gamma 1
LETYENLLETKELAEKAVRDGDNTLKKANHTYHLLQSFQDEVSKSEITAKVALENVDDIIEKIRDTENLISEAENVSL